MFKVLAVLRTLFLVSIVVYTVIAMQVFTKMAITFDEQYARCSSSRTEVMRAAWIAIAWIAFETVVGWLVARGKRSRGAHGAPAAAPPTPRG
jgi:H+/Cl- antiporter ClcA